MLVVFYERDGVLTSSKIIFVLNFPKYSEVPSKREDQNKREKSMEKYLPPWSFIY